MTWQPQPAHPEFPDCAVRCGWLFASKCRAGCFYCGSRAGFEQQLAAGARWWTDEQALQAWQLALEHYGPVMIDFTGLECTEELDLMGAVLRLGHAGIVNTNLMFDPAEFAAKVPADRCLVCTSFHTHLWNRDPAVFLRRVDRVRATGHRVVSASLVAHPSYLDRARGWMDGLRGGGLYATIHPFIGEWQGRRYPEAYTDDDRALIDELLGVEREKAALALNLEPPRIAACAAGWLYFAVQLDGTVKRCMGDPGTMGNFYRDGLTLATRPEPCRVGRCACEALYQFHIPEGCDYDTG